MLDEEQRKRRRRRREAYHAADFAVLCLPDDAARSRGAGRGQQGADHRCVLRAPGDADGWTYGFPESSGATGLPPPAGSAIPAAIPPASSPCSRRWSARACCRRLALCLPCRFGLFGRRQGADRPVRGRPTSPFATMAWDLATSMCRKCSKLCRPCRMRRCSPRRDPGAPRHGGGSAAAARPMMGAPLPVTAAPVPAAISTPAASCDGPRRHARRTAAAPFDGAIGPARPLRLRRRRTARRRGWSRCSTTLARARAGRRCRTST
jgi:hypothetical protein